MFRENDLELRPYGNTAARNHFERQEKYNLNLTIDAHCHLHVQESADLVQGLFDTNFVPAFRYTNETTSLQNKKQNKDRSMHLTNIDQRLRDMDRQGIDMQVLIPVPFQAYYSIRNKKGHKAIEIINNTLSKVSIHRPDRFLSLGHLPLQDPEAAVKEMERCVKELDLRGFQVLGTVDGHELSDPSMDPVWETAQKLNTLIFIHPNGYPQGDRLKNHYFNNVIGNPLDTTVALHHLIFDGTLERFPDLKILVSHGGGYLPSYAGRIDHAWGARPDCREKINSLPSSYLKKLNFDSIVFTYEQLKYLVDVFGANKIVMGTDYPFDMGEDDPMGHVLGTSGISEEDIKKITGINAAKLLGIKL